MLRSSIIVATFLVALFCLALVASSQSTATGNEIAEETLELVAAASEQVKAGAELYSFHCAACHGNTGLGIAEARLAFPEDHRDCESCHKPGNPKKAADIPTIETNERNCFALGEPPVLRSSEALSTFANAQVLYSYIQATMPRWQPNNLTTEEYLDITAFLLAFNSRLPKDITLTKDNALSIGF
jgi:hypothetical protein